MAPSACASSRKMPSAQQDCIVPGTAGSSLNSSCSLADACSAAQPGGSVPHRVLNSTSGTCDCAQGWGGDLCTIPLLQPPTPCTRGVVDLNGTCCVGLVDAVSGLCCGDNPADREGRCCDAGVVVDACGVCGGTGVAVDAQGTCCSSPLPPSGLCCVNGTVDSCGVCGGDNSCR